MLHFQERGHPSHNHDRFCLHHETIVSQSQLHPRPIYDVFIGFAFSVRPSVCSRNRVRSRTLFLDLFQTFNK